MKGDPIRGPKFSGISDGMSQIDFTDSEDSRQRRNRSPLLRASSIKPPTKPEPKKTDPTINTKNASNNKGKTSLDNRTQKNKSDKK